MREKTIPTLIGIVLVIIALTLTIILVQIRTNLQSQADALNKPKNILISNLKSDQFSLSWYTDKETSGFVTYGETSSLGNFALDKRDKNSGSRGKFKLHFVTVSGLKPEKEYFFKITSDNSNFGGNVSSAVSCQDFFEASEGYSFFKIKTQKNSSEAVNLRNFPINGFISQDQTEKIPASGVFVCVQIPNAMPISDLTTNSGSFVIPLVSVYKNDGKLLTNLSPETIEEIFVSGPNGEKTFAKIKSQFDHPVPIMQLDKSYDFNKTIVSSISPTPIITNATDSTPSTSFEIISPNGIISDTLPTFRGKGEAGQILEIKVESEEVLSGSVKIDQNGFWTWTPPSTITPGEHTVTITGRDKKGILQKITKNFTVLAANPIMPKSEGTPSAILSPTPTTRPTPTLLPSPTPTEIPILTATPTVPVLLDSATSTPFFVFLTIGIVSVTLGILMFFKKTV